MLSLSDALSSRTSHFEPPPQWAAMRKAVALERDDGRRIVHFEKGDFQGPEFQPAQHILEACERALREGYVRYSPGPGLPELREAVAAEMSGRGRATAPDEVLITMGAKHALMQSLLSLVDVEDEVVFPNPGYPPDEFWIRYAGGKVRYTPLMEPDYGFDLDRLEQAISPRTKLVVINTPQRPNGMVVQGLQEIAEIAQAKGVMVLSDEIFSRMVYSPAVHSTIAAIEGMADQTVVVDTLSKTYAMTGFRIGWCVGPRELIETLDTFQQNSVTNVPVFVQLAALAALTGDQSAVAERTSVLEAKRDRTVRALNAMPGIDCPTPDGSFYVFPNIRETGLSAQELADNLVEEHSIAVVSGAAFGSQGDGHVRITYALPDEQLDEGLARMGAAMEQLATTTAK